MKTSILTRMLAALVALPAAAAADIPPLPGEAEAFRRDLIRRAGHSCSDPVALTKASAAQEESFRQKGLQAVLARCGDGKTYLVATPPRRPPPPGEAPRPEPVVVPVE
jgi:hypothetical protein